ncbi:MAG: hypothetical protein AVDCRST_MAG05-4710 [uncultured Rubrobacteraceae bacterium]|uniref:Uncharacterized protein n=1 Tax=uncultured Rubrobacteraceae bacterium TaxID=349277 RepID=A0A6J4TWK4_9ACTN|nr:MAG: hypothetical protein AVDCRST_MAG05-4710 [uncultured Rubrobacteraceae bacterium]
MERLEGGQGGPTETHASLLPGATDAPASEDRHRVYKMTGLKALGGAEDAPELSGDVVVFPRNRISSQ